MPNVVKGSKQEKMVVVPYRPSRRAFFMAVAVMVVIASTLAGFLYGYYETRSTQEVAQASREELNVELASLREENTELSRQIAIFDRSRVMDQRANEEVQTTILALRGRVAQLEQDIVYYRQVVSEETGSTGLMISQLDIEATSDANRFKYKLVMRQQDADGETYLIGHVNVNLVGGQGSEQVVLPLRDLSAEQDNLDILLRFRIFQAIEGELIIPDGFKPERVQIAAVSIEPVSKSIDQDFSWVVEGE